MFRVPSQHTALQHTPACTDSPNPGTLLQGLHFPADSGAPGPQPQPCCASGAAKTRMEGQQSGQDQKVPRSLESLGWLSQSAVQPKKQRLIEGGRTSECV